MAAYSERIVEKIVAMIEEGNYSISTICKIVGIGRKTFYEWKNKYPEFLQALEDAEQRRMDELHELASTALRKKLEGYYQTTSRTVYTPSAEYPETLEIKEHVVTRKFCEPDAKLLLDILNGQAGRKKKRGLSKKNLNPALIVKRNERDVQKDVDEIPPFTIKAKEVVEQDMNRKLLESSESISIKSEEEIKTSETESTSKQIIKKEIEKEQPLIKENEEKPKSSKYVQYMSTFDPLPPGYTRRG